MKIYNEFSLNLLQLNSEDSLEEQRNESLNFIVVENKDE